MNKMLHWATGAGKTKAALDLTRSFAKDNHLLRLKLLILVAERQHIQVWKDEMMKWDFPTTVSEPTIMCYASIRKAKGSWDMVIFDECHHVATKKRIEAMREIRTQNVVALSATPGDSLNALQLVYGPFEVSEQKLKTLINNGRLPTPEVFVYDLNLDKRGNPSEQSRYDLVQREIKTTRSKYLWRKSDNDKFQMYQAGLKRKRLLGELKIPYVSYLLDKIQDKRYICFCPTIEIARQLYSMHSLGSFCINSKEKSSRNKEMLERFNDYEFDHIFAVGMLTEGTNLKGIEAGIVMQLDNNERTMIQKFGRTLRAEHPKMYFFRFLSTKDEELTKSVAWNIGSEHITNVEFKPKWIGR